MSDQSNSGEGVELLCGYSTKKVMASAGLALVLHVVVIAGYVVLGSSKKLKTAETADAKPVAEKSKTDAKPGTKDDKAPTPAKNDKPGEKESVKTEDGKKSIEEKKNTEVAAPNEIPKAPDNDLDDIIKRK